MNKATVWKFGDSIGKKVVIVACGEMVRPALEAAKILEKEGSTVTVLDMCCGKPFDSDALINAADGADLVVSVEEHAPFGGLGSNVASVVAANKPCKVVQMALPDDHVITGKSKAVFDYYGLNSEGIATTVKGNL
jgi:transketolase